MWDCDALKIGSKIWVWINGHFTLSMNGVSMVANISISELIDTLLALTAHFSQALQTLWRAFSLYVIKFDLYHLFAACEKKKKLQKKEKRRLSLLCKTFQIPNQKCGCWIIPGHRSVFIKLDVSLVCEPISPQVWPFVRNFEISTDVRRCEVREERKRRKS